MSFITRNKHDIYPFISTSQTLANSAVGQTVLVTGASQGVGRAIALHFALAGAHTIIITARTLSKLSETEKIIREKVQGCNVICVEADVTKENDVEKMFKDLKHVPGILVNNAGISGCQKSIVDSKPDAWWRDLETNIKGPYLFTRAYLKLLDGKPGVIINTSSSVSDMVVPGLSSYSVSKTAINRFTQFIQEEYSNQCIRSVTFHPGGIAETGMGQAAPEDMRSRLYDTVDLAAGTAVYLSTPRASFLDGRFVYANWDMEKLEARKEDILRDDLLKSKIHYGDFLGSAVVAPE